MPDERWGGSPPAGLQMRVGLQNVLRFAASGRLLHVPHTRMGALVGADLMPEARSDDRPAGLRTQRR